MNTSDFLIDDALLKAFNRRINTGGRFHPAYLLENFERFPCLLVTTVQLSQVVADVFGGWKQLGSAVHERFGFSHQSSLEQYGAHRPVQSFI